ncbi:magnetosome-associated protein MamJ-like [Homarus americanus]|uniref:magnetosome-associated protein MamJ-like n=1 Tax=Homarus americanus TaxID=6706 RepID=UPI001C43920A|nr:magnetosome-associated protein MamJ-like [Homarus americanus]
MPYLSDQPSEAMMGLVSTWIGDRLALRIPDVADIRTLLKKASHGFGSCPLSNWLTVFTVGTTYLVVTAMVSCWVGQLRAIPLPDTPSSVISIPPPGIKFSLPQGKSISLASPTGNIASTVPVLKVVPLPVAMAQQPVPSPVMMAAEPMPSPVMMAAEPMPSPVMMAAEPVPSPVMMAAEPMPSPVMVAAEPMPSPVMMAAEPMPSLS